MQDLQSLISTAVLATFGWIAWDHVRVMRARLARTRAELEQLRVEIARLDGMRSGIEAIAEAEHVDVTLPRATARRPPC